MNEEYVKYIVGYSFLTGGLVLGSFMEFFILKRLRNSVPKTRWKGNKLLLFSLKGIVFGLFTLLGAYITFRYLPYDDQVQGIANNVFFSMLVFMVTIFFSRMLVGIIRVRSENTDGLVKTGSIMANITRIIIYILGVLIILQGLGVSITPMLTALGVGGLAVALALQDTLSNLFSGIQVIASKQIKPGDYVKLDSGEEGYVTDITWRNTTIRTLPNNIVVVPNSKIATTILTNYYLPDKEISVLVEVSVSYDSDLKKVEEVTTEIAESIIKNTPGAVKTHKPFIRYHTFGDSGISFSVILRGKEFTDQYLIKHEFVKALHKGFNENHILIPYPTRTIQLKQEKQS